MKKHLIAFREKKYIVKFNILQGLETAAIKTIPSKICPSG